MKNLKKVLALVLVVAMMASFAVSAGAASFTDNDKIVYDNAVTLLSDLDVINGFTDGSFNPEGNVTRAQTAKMIAYIMNGGEDASSTFAASAKFNDVALRNQGDRCRCRQQPVLPEQRCDRCAAGQDGSGCSGL